LSDLPRTEGALPGLDELKGLVAWFPNLQAQQQADRLGLPLGSPAPDVVRRVHDKAFSSRVAREHQLGPQPVADAIGVFEPEDLQESERAARLIEEHVASWPSWMGRKFFLKPRIGTSGRGKVVGSDGKLGGPARQRLPGLARAGGAVVEPWLERSHDFSSQMWISKEGVVHQIGSTRQLLTESGVYRGNLGTWDDSADPSSGTVHDELLRHAARVVGEAAAREGFWGPCGIDAFTYADPEQGELLRPLVEFNARFTTGWIALGILGRAGQIGLLDGVRAWCFRLRGPSRGWSSLESPPSVRRLVFRGQGLSPAEEPALLLGPELAALQLEGQEAD
jgi:hypothetical protein